MGFIPFRPIDLLDIILVALLLAYIYRAMRGTTAPLILGGIISIYIVWIAVKALNMELLSTILGQIISVGVIALMIVFQPELRRFLHMIGSRQKKFRFLSRIFPDPDKAVVTESPIVTACIDMSKTKTGALIVITQNDDISPVIESGINIDATITSSLLKNIFFKNAPLHDGAVVISHNRILAAKCILPVTQSPVPKEYGTRHRSAIGLSEVADAVVVVVSEETGGISIAKKGMIERDIDYSSFQDRLRKALGME